VRIARRGTFVAASGTPATAARSSGRQTWAVLVPTMEYFYPPILHAIEDEARRRDVCVVFNCTGRSLEQERQLVEQRVADGVSGIIIAPTDPEDLAYTGVGGRPALPRPQGSLDYLAELPVPVVVIDRTGCDTVSIGMDCVVKDDFAGVYQATTHLIRHGYRDIVLFANRVPDRIPLPHETQRVRGYHVAMADHDVPVPDLPPVRNWDVDYNPDAIRRCIDAGARAFVVLCDPTAAALLRLLGRWNIAVPDRIAVIGFDDEPICDLTDPPLSSVSIPKAEMATKAVQLLTDRISSGKRGDYRSIVLSPKVVARESCGRNCRLSAERLGLQDRGVKLAGQSLSGIAR